MRLGEDLGAREGLVLEEESSAAERGANENETEPPNEN